MQKHLRIDNASNEDADSNGSRSPVVEEQEYVIRDGVTKI